MDFDLDEDELALQAAASALLDDLASSERVRAVMDGVEGIDRDLWRAMVDQGWVGVELPEDDGGLGLGTAAAAVLLEQVGRHCAPAPYLSSLLAVDALARATRQGTPEAAPWVERLVAGEVVGCAGWGAGLVVGAPVADVAVVAVGDDLLMVDLERQGRPRAEPAMDRTRVIGWLELEPAADTVVRIGGRADVDAFLDRGAALTSAEMLGGAGCILDMSIDYAKERVQFDRPIGSFQAVKHRCADMLVDVEGMRSTAYHAAWCIGAAHPDASIAASTAKVWCSDASKRVMASGLQVHGGIGFTWEHDLHLFLKRSQLDQVSFGDAVFHRERLAGLLRPKVEAGEGVF